MRLVDLIKDCDSSILNQLNKENMVVDALSRKSASVITYVIRFNEVLIWEIEILELKVSYLAYVNIGFSITDDYSHFFTKED